MNREDFLDTLVRQFTEEVREAYVECEHTRTAFDTADFEKRVHKIWKAAELDGVSKVQFRAILMDVVPDYVDRIPL